MEEQNFDKQILNDFYTSVPKYRPLIKRSYLRGEERKPLCRYIHYRDVP